MAAVLSCARNGPFSADNVILANNAFARRLGFLRSRLVTIYTYAGVTPVLDAAQQALLGQRDQWGVIPANRLGTTLRRIRGGRFMVRSAYSLRGRATAGAHGRTVARVVPAPLSATSRA